MKTTSSVICDVPRASFLKRALVYLFLFFCHHVRDTESCSLAIIFHCCRYRRDNDNTTLHYRRTCQMGDGQDGTDRLHDLVGPIIVVVIIIV